MSVINNSRSLFKSIDVLNYETSKSSSTIKDKFLNIDKNSNSNKYETLNQPSNAIDYFSFSSNTNTNEMYYSDTEGSKLLILPQQNKSSHNMSTVLPPASSSKSDTDYYKLMYNKPLATSSPLKKLNDNIKNKYYCKKKLKKVSIQPKFSINDIKSKPNKDDKFFKNSKKTISSYTVSSTDTPNLINKTALLKYKNLLITEKREKTYHTTFNNIKQVSQNNFNDKTNILYTNSSQITLQKPTLSTNMTLIKKSKNDVFQLNLLSNNTVNSNLNKSKNVNLMYSIKNGKTSLTNNIEENQTLYKSTTIISNNSQMTYNINKHTSFDENHLNDTDVSDIFLMELSLKMFSGNIVPHLNSMKHEILQIMNKCMYKPDEQIIIRWKHIKDIIINIKNIMNLNIYNGIDSLSNKKDYSTISFVGVDLNNLNLLNNKLENINKKLESVKFMLYNNILNDQEEESIDQLFVQNDLLEFNSCDNIKTLFKPATDTNNDVISSTKTGALDSFSCVRELNKSNSLLFPMSNCIDINESPKQQLLENCSLICINELPINEISKTKAQDISNSSHNEICIDKLAPINRNLSSNFEVVNYNDNPVETNESHYWLRKNPKSTELFISPFSYPKKKSCIKSSYNDMFLCRGTGKNKVILQYKIKSVLKANSDEFMKQICPESKNKKFINDQNTSVIDISNMKPKKIEKPCQCGIFPSQTPAYWNDSLHKSLHKNLHKLQFKSQIPVNVASKINNNGFLFNIIKVTENCDDFDLRLTIKNIQDFINLEINFSKKNMSILNRSIFLAVNPKFKIVGYLEIEPLKNACIYQNNKLSTNLVAVKFGIYKLWVMVKYRNNGVATKLLKQFCDEENLKTNDIAFAFHGNHGISFIQKYFANNSVLIY